jgi:hypothetical protein
MKTALLISGQARFCKEFDTQLDNLKNSEVDWYVAVWKIQRDNGVWRDWLISPSWTANTEEEARAFIEPRLPSGHRLVEVQLIDKEKFPPLPRQYVERLQCEPEMLFQQYWMVYQCDLLRQKHNIEYDLLIRSRADIGLRTAIDLKKAHHLLINNPNVILTPDDRRGNLIDDTFGVGLPHTIQKYGDIVNHFDRVYTENQGLSMATETMVAVTLMDLGVQFPMTGIGRSLRTLGDGVERSEDNSHFHPDFGRWA